MSAKHLTDKEVVVGICKELLEFNNKKTQFQKWAKALHGHFMKGDF